MQTNLFYPTQQTQSETIDITNAVDNISIDSLKANNMGAPYYLGYVKWDDFPKCARLYKINATNDQITFETNPQNMGWGYCLEYGVSTTFYGEVQCYALGADNTLRRTFGSSVTDNNTIKLINHAKMACVNTKFDTTFGDGVVQNVQVKLLGCCFSNDNLPDNDTYLGDQYNSNKWGATAGREFNIYSINLTTQILQDYFDNNVGITITTTNHGTFTIHETDFNEYGIAKVQNSDGTSVGYFTVINLFTNTQARYGYTTTSQTYAQNASTIVPFFGFNFGDLSNAVDNNYPSIFVPYGNLYSTGYISVHYIAAYDIINPNNIYKQQTFNGCILGNHPYTIVASELKDAGIAYRAVGIVGGKYIVNQGGGSSADHIHYFYPQHSFGDWYKLLCFYHKALPKTNTITTADYQTYTTSFSTSLFDDNDSPKFERVNGDASDTAFIAKLRDWQLPDADITVNDFDANDIPEYVPPAPVDDSENIGDKITRPATLGIGGTNGFVTLYALRKSDIAQLGALLWTSFVDADYWKNYLFSLALDTGTFSLAGLLNFFVSCRVYPFSLINIAGCSSFGQNMYVGTGIVPLEFTAQTTLHVLSDMVDYISGGYCNIPRHFNDWRDYVNTEIMLYIPYCGTVRLNPGDVIGNKISVQYAVDFATGGCIAYVDMETGDGAGYPVGALPGQIGADIPLTATAAGEVAARFIGDALNIGGIVAGEGANVASGALGAAMGKPSGGSGNVLSGAAGMLGGLPAAMAVDMAVPLAKQGLSMLARGAVQAPMLSGGRGFASFGAPQVPYIQIRRGIYPEISSYATVQGEPAAATQTIAQLSGFIKGAVKADGLNCHQSEKEEIIELLSTGIYI